MGMIAFAIIPIPQKLALQDFPGGSVVKKKKKSACQFRRHGFDP